MGDNALHPNTIGSDNTEIGRNALSNNTAGSDNTAVGASAGEAVTAADHVICIGHSGANVSNSCFIGHIYGTTIDPGTAVNAGNDASGKLGTVASSRPLHHVGRYSCKVELHCCPVISQGRSIADSLGSMVLAVILLITGVAVYAKLRRLATSNECRALMDSRRRLVNVIELKEWWYFPDESHPTEIRVSVVVRQPGRFAGNMTGEQTDA